MIISSDAEKVFDKIQHSFILKVLGISGIHDTYLNILKEIYNNPVANIRIQGEKLKAIRWKSGTWKSCSLFPYQFNTVLEVQVIAIKQ